MVSKEADLTGWREWIDAEMIACAQRYYPEATTLHAACRYALEGQGKRIRPLLALATHRACLGVEPSQVLLPALALEWVHTYSLVHDDLPCMDNDDLRRGRPTTHKAFDDATALLAGDALLTDAFRLIEEAPQLSEAQRLGMIGALARAAGGQGMVLGQALDMFWTGKDTYSQQDLDRIHQNKTGCLIEAACALGSWAAGSAPEHRRIAQEFGAKVGLTFQIIDDLLDTKAHIGKTSGKDAASGKLTYLRLMSVEAAEARAHQLTQEAMGLAEQLPGPKDALLELAQQLLQRQH